MGSDHQLVCDQCFEPSCVADPGVGNRADLLAPLPLVVQRGMGTWGKGAQKVLCVACVSHAPCFEMHRGWKELEGSKTADL
jgi:hypothetical protein